MNQVITRAGQTVAKNSPIILTIGGVVGIGVTIFLACRATLKAQKVVEDHTERREKVEEKFEKSEDVTDKEYTRELAKVYGKTIADMTKLYAVPVVLGVASIVSILGGYKILSDRNVKLTSSLAAVTAAYQQLDKFTKQYRKRVYDDAGVDKDLEYAFGLTKEKSETVSPDGKKENLKGKLHTKDGVSKKDISDFEKLNPYVAVFDERSREYKSSPAMNMTTINGQLNAWNDIAKARIAEAKCGGAYPVITQNEVRRSLDLPETSAGAVTGWDLASDDYDGFIDFGLNTVTYPQNELFAEGRLTACILEFNCTGPVVDCFDKQVDYAWLNK